MIAQVTLVGDRIPGAELLRLGLATQCVDDAPGGSMRDNLAKRLASFPSGTTSKIKRGMRARLGETADQWFDRHTQWLDLRLSPAP